MSVYVDASVLVALFTDDALAISDFAAAEFASAIARHVRMRAIRSDVLQNGKPRKIRTGASFASRQSGGWEFGATLHGM